MELGGICLEIMGLSEAPFDASRPGEDLKGDCNNNISDKVVFYLVKFYSHLPSLLRDK